MQNAPAQADTKPIPLPQRKPGQGPKAVPAGKSAPVARPAGAARRKPRHSGLIASFMALVALPTIISGTYLGVFAVDQYTSTVGFAVKSEKSSTSIDLMGGISQLTGGSSTDASMVAAYLQSQDLVEKLDSELDLRALFSKPFKSDPVFAFNPSGSIEDLVYYWNHMVTVSFDSGTGLIEMDVQAFTPQSAQAITQAAFKESARMINELSAIAQDDATKSAREEVAQAEVRLRRVRKALAAFRNRTQIVDPSADVTGQMGVLNSLQDQLVAAMIDLDLLQNTTRQNDPRILEAQRKVKVIQARMADERQTFGKAQDGPDAKSYAVLVGEFESLSVDQDFAEKSYAAALATLDAAEADARQQSLYLAAYVKPTLAQSSIQPRRFLLTALVALFLFLGWAILALIYYSVRDRR